MASIIKRCDCGDWDDARTRGSSATAPRAAGRAGSGSSPSATT